MYFTQILLISILLLSCAKPTQHEVENRSMRFKKDQMFKTGKQSPLNDDQKKSFEGLVYFNYDDDFRVEATLVKNDSAPIFPMPTTQGTKKFFQYIGDLHFKIDGEPFQLRALKATFYKSNYFFVPFKDLTTAKSTYFTGRYMEVRKGQGETYIIDFNTAYNPWCNYSDAYNCPIPVTFNHLDIAVEAGEKIYHHSTN
jgi:uncharacterized protein (DUF1684 family)